jgi:hypothetical protein
VPDWALVAISVVPASRASRSFVSMACLLVISDIGQLHWFATPSRCQARLGARMPPCRKTAGERWTISDELWKRRFRNI